MKCPRCGARPTAAVVAYLVVLAGAALTALLAVHGACTLAARPAPDQDPMLLRMWMGLYGALALAAAAACAWGTLSLWTRSEEARRQCVRCGAPRGRA